MHEENFPTEYLQARQWYAIYSKPRKEDFAQFHLQRKGLEVFFPRLLLPHPLPKRGQVVPLFPNYLFVRLQLPDEYYYALWSPGVKSLVSFNGTPAPLDDEIVTFLRQRATAEGLLAGRSNLTVGQEVRISGGPLDGLAGIIQDPPDAKGRVNVLMKLLSRQVKVEVPVRFVEGSWIVPDKQQHRTIASAR
jgi:transcription elongation factor/antiterminator RfaH